MQLILYQFVTNYGEALIFIQVRFLVKMNDSIEVETASHSLYYPCFLC